MVSLEDRWAGSLSLCSGGCRGVLKTGGLRRYPCVVVVVVVSLECRWAGSLSLCSDGCRGVLKTGRLGRLSLCSGGCCGES